MTSLLENDLCGFKVECRSLSLPELFRVRDGLELSLQFPDKILTEYLKIVKAEIASRIK